MRASYFSICGLLAILFQASILLTACSESNNSAENDQPFSHDSFIAQLTAGRLALKPDTLDKLYRDWYLDENAVKSSLKGKSCLAVLTSGSETSYKSFFNYGDPSFYSCLLYKDTGDYVISDLGDTLRYRASFQDPQIRVARMPDSLQRFSVELFSPYGSEVCYAAYNFRTKRPVDFEYCPFDLIHGIHTWPKNKKFEYRIEDEDSIHVRWRPDGDGYYSNSSSAPKDFIKDLFNGNIGWAIFDKKHEGKYIALKYFIADVSFPNEYNNFKPLLNKVIAVKELISPEKLFVYSYKSLLASNKTSTSESSSEKGQPAKSIDPLSLVGVYTNADLTLEIQQVAENGDITGSYNGGEFEFTFVSKLDGNKLEIKAEESNELASSEMPVMNLTFENDALKGTFRRSASDAEMPIEFKKAK